MEKTEEIIKRYYRGETSIEEEKFLKAQYRSGHLIEDPHEAQPGSQQEGEGEPDAPHAEQVQQEAACAVACALHRAACYDGEIYIRSSESPHLPAIRLPVLQQYP